MLTWLFIILRKYSFRTRTGRNYDDAFYGDDVLTAKVEALLRAASVVAPSTSSANSSTGSSTSTASAAAAPPLSFSSTGISGLQKASQAPDMFVFLSHYLFSYLSLHLFSVLLVVHFLLGIFEIMINFLLTFECAAFCRRCSYRHTAKRNSRR